jgi:hypothetical protein
LRYVTYPTTPFSPTQSDPTHAWPILAAMTQTSAVLSHGLAEAQRALAGVAEPMQAHRNAITLARTPARTWRDCSRPARNAEGGVRELGKPGAESTPRSDRCAGRRRVARANALPLPPGERPRVRGEYLATLASLVVARLCPPHPRPFSPWRREKNLSEGKPAPIASRQTVPRRYRSLPRTCAYGPGRHESRTRRP